MFGISKHAKEVIGLLSDGGITHSEAMVAIEKYDRIMLRWQLTALSVVIAAAILTYAATQDKKQRFKSGSECVIAKIKPGMSSEAARFIHIACMSEFGDY